MKNQLRVKPAKWKWAFFILLFVNLITILSLYFALFNPANSGTEPVHTTTTSPDPEESLQAVVSLKNKDVEALLQGALITSGTDSITQVRVEDNLYLEGEISILGLPVSYLIEAEPFLVEEGDLQLKVQSIQLGNLSLPIKQTMNIMMSQFSDELPIAIDSDNQLLTIFLTSMQFETIQKIKLLQIDKEVQEYTFEITILKENLLQ